MSGATAAMAVASRIPAGVWQPLSRAGAALVALRPPRPLRQWQQNAEVVTGRRPDRAETRAAGTSWARNLFETLQLEHWSHEQVQATVIISDDDMARLQEAQRTTGLVVALPHMGSWDLVGAWACLNGLPVSTVAEQVPAFEYFVRVREALGMRVYGLRDRGVMRRLEADQRAGRVVCLVSDRHFGHGGVPVSWHTATGEQALRMPAGAAHLSLATCATLLGAACHYEGDRMRVVVSGPADADDVAGRNQQLADFFCEQVRSDVVDWHVLQPFFEGVRVR